MPAEEKRQEKKSPRTFFPSVTLRHPSLIYMKAALSAKTLFAEQRPQRRMKRKIGRKWVTPGR